MVGSNPLSLVVTAYLVMVAVMVGLRRGVNMPGWLLTWIGPVGMGWVFLKARTFPGWSDRPSRAWERTIEPTNAQDDSVST